MLVSPRLLFGLSLVAACFRVDAVNPGPPAVDGAGEPNADGAPRPPMTAPAPWDGGPVPTGDAAVGPEAAPPADAALSVDLPAARDAAPADAATVPNPSDRVSCANLPAGPIATTKIAGILPVEDITFDDSGNLYWNREEGGIMKTTADGTGMLFVPKVEVWAGMRWTPSGDLYIETDNGLERVSPAGARTVVLSGAVLNGMEVDPQGRVYVSELHYTRIFRYDPRTSKSTVLSTGVIDTPNGLTFNPAFDILYVSNWGGHDPPTLHRIPINPDGTAAKTEVWVTKVGTGTFDGMAADECGNIYVANSNGAGEILRFTPDGKSHTVLIKRPGETLHNFMWGRGKGWSETKLYIVSLEEGLFEAELGVRSKKYW